MDAGFIYKPPVRSSHDSLVSPKFHARGVKLENRENPHKYRIKETLSLMFHPFTPTRPRAYACARVCVWGGVKLRKHTHPRYWGERDYPPPPQGGVGGQ